MGILPVIKLNLAVARTLKPSLTLCLEISVSFAYYLACGSHFDPPPRPSPLK